jgi:Fic family protein
MLSFPITSATTKKLKALQSLISEKYSEISNLSQEELESIHRYARISMIGASTRIENAVLTDSEISWLDTILAEDGKTTAFQDKKYLIEDKLSKDRERSIEEVAGCRAMLAIIYEQAKDMLPLTEVNVRGLHQELLRHYNKAKQYRGQYKTAPNSVVERNQATGKQRDVFRTAEPGVVTKAAMTELMDWYTKALIEEPWSVAVACEFVFRFLAIHPFQDGNGRLGRGLFLLSVLQCPDDHVSFVVRYLAIDRQIEKHKEDYYQVLNRCSEGKYHSNPKKYHIEYFLDFMIKVLTRAIKDIDFYRKKYRAFQELSASALQVLACFQDEPETRLQTGDLVTKTKLPRRTVSNVLVILQKEGFLQKYGKARAVRYQIIF